MSRANLKQIIPACTVVLMCGCAARGVPCDGQLQPINPPMAASEISAAPESPIVEGEVPDRKGRWRKRSCSRIGISIWMSIDGGTN